MTQAEETALKKELLTEKIKATRLELDATRSKAEATVLKIERELARHTVDIQTRLRNLELELAALTGERAETKENESCPEPQS